MLEYIRTQYKNTSVPDDCPTSVISGRAQESAANISSLLSRLQDSASELFPLSNFASAANRGMTHVALD